MNLLPSEQLAFTTARIRATLPEGGTSTGTGFFFSFHAPSSPDKTVPVLVTNKHLLAGADTITFHMTRKSANGEPLVGDFVQVQIGNVAAQTINHPIPDVDLCAFLAGPLLNKAQTQNTPFFFRSLDSSMIPTPDELADLAALEDVIMVGYPIGLWDSANNMPVFRRGVTATHTYLDYESKKEFLVDMACFPGSSGSPVLLYNINGYISRKGSHLAATRVKLLGTLYAAPQFDAKGEIHIVPVPTATKAITLSQIPINVGVVIKAERILELETVVQSMMARSST